ncbi:MAG: lytic transglycosylase domain-containing protein [Alphaproteobacteria bacterium]
MHTVSDGSPRRGSVGLLVAGIGLAMALSACSSPRQTTPQVAAAAPGIGAAPARTPSDYAPPGPPEDPWGPYITEAAARFGVPEIWIREVMRQESGGRQYINGRLTTSRVGAAGLMQVMPATYAELAAQHGLGPDRYHPRDNILAGTAYIRDMHDRYGFPSFLAAYNAGPGRLESHLYGGRPLPAETRNYLASVAPRLAGSAQATGQLAFYAVPERSADDLNRSALAYGGAAPSAAEATATAELNRRSLDAAPAARRPTLLASAAPVSTPAPAARPVSAPAVMAPVASAPVLTASVAPSAPIAAPVAAPVAAPASPVRTAATPQSGRGIQVGAFSSAALARAAAETARAQGGGLLRVAETVVSPVTRGDGAVLYRAWLVGLSPDLAAPACDTLSRQGTACMVLTADRTA